VPSVGVPAGLRPAIQRAHPRAAPESRPIVVATTLAAASNPRLKAGVIDLIDKSLPNALKRMQLVE